MSEQNQSQPEDLETLMVVAQSKKSKGKISFLDSDGFIVDELYGLPPIKYIKSLNNNVIFEKAARILIMSEYKQFGIPHPGFDALNVYAYEDKPKRIPPNWSHDSIISSDKQSGTLPVDDSNKFDLYKSNKGFTVIERKEIKLKLNKSALRDLRKLISPDRFRYPVKNVDFLKRPRPNLSIKVLGIGDNSAVRYNNSSFIVEADRKYLVDCPPRINAILGKTGVKPIDLRDIIVTHNHDDHIGGLGAFLLEHLRASRTFENYGKIRIYTTSDIYKDLTGQFYGGGIYKTIFKDLVEFIELKDSDPFKRNGITIDIRHNLHAIDTPTIGFKFSYKGKTLGYSSDCKYAGKYCLNSLEKNFEESVTKLNSKLNFIIDEAVSEDGWFGDYSGGENYNPENRIKYQLVNELKPGTGYFETWFTKFSNKIINNFPDFDEIEKRQKGIRLEDHISNFKSILVNGFKNFICTQSFDWFSNCDTIIHEATDNPNDTVHTDVSELENLPLSIKQKMYLTHIPNSFPKKKYSIPILKEFARYDL